MARRSRASDDTAPGEAPVPRSVAAPAPTETPAPRGRRPRATTAPAPEPVAEATDATPAVRRRRRRRVVDQTAQNQLIIVALLTARGSQGATQDEILKVAHWARLVNTETEELAAIAKRPRLRKSESSLERQASAELNRHLLDGVLAGSYSIDVNESGDLVFGGWVSSG